jgi:hypothetical protein
MYSGREVRPVKNGEQNLCLFRDSGISHCLVIGKLPDESNNPIGKFNLFFQPTFPTNHSERLPDYFLQVFCKYNMGFSFINFFPINLKILI